MQYAREHLAAVEWALHVADKLHLYGALLEHNLFAAQPLSQPSERDNVHQFLSLVGYGPETVFQSVAVSIKVSVIVNAVQFTVEQHALAAARHVGVGEVHLEVALYGAVVHEVVARELLSLVHLLLIQVGKLLVLQFGDGLRQNLLIGFVAQVFHKSTLFRAKEVTRPPDVEVLHGEVESAAQFGECLERLQPSSCFGCEYAFGRSYEVAERLLVAAPHTSPHLVQVAQSEVVGIVDDDGVGVGDVYAVLHDGGGEEHIVVVVDEIHDDLLQFLGLHLSVSYRHTAVGHAFFYEQFQFGEFRDAVVHEVHLSVAAHLKVDGIGNGIAAEADNLRVYGIPVGWRCAHDAHVPGAHERELQCARYGRGAHGEGVHVHLQLAQFLLGRDAKLLFLVDDEQSQVFPFYALGDELVRAYEDVNPALLQVVEQLARSLCRACTAQVVHPYGHSFEACLECLVMLESEDGGGYEHSYLLAVACCLEGCPYSHLRLSESYVAAHQAVHGACLFHVGLYLLCGLVLVGCVLIEEGGFQFVLQVRVGTEGKPLLAAPARIQLDEVARNVLDAFLGLLLQAVPGTRSEGRKAWRFARVATAVLAYLVERVDGHVHLVVVLVHDANHLLVAVAHGHAHQSAKLAYTEVYVHDKVAGFHLLQFLHGERHLSCACRVGAQTVLVEPVEYLVVGKEAALAVVVHESLVQGFVHGHKVYVVALQFLAAEDVLEALLLLGAVGKDVERVAFQDVVLESLCQEVEVLVEQWLRGNVEGDGCRGLSFSRACFCGGGIGIGCCQFYPPERSHSLLKLYGGAQVGILLHGAAYLFSLHLGGALQLLGKALRGESVLVYLRYTVVDKGKVAQHHHRVRCEVLQEGLLHGLRGRKLGHYLHVVAALFRQLVFYAEGAYGVYLVTEEVDAEGIFTTVGVDVEDAAAHGKLPRFVYIVGLVEAEFAQGVYGVY